MVGFLIKNHNAGINPANKLNDLLADRQKLVNKVELVDKEITKLTEHIKKFEEWKKKKTVKKCQAIRILKQKILNREFEDVERLSKVWQRMTGVPAIELIAEASEGLNRSGV